MPCTLESFLRHECGLSRRQLAKLKHVPDGMLCNGQHIRSIDRVQSGDRICLHIPDVPNMEPNPSLHAPVIFEDEDVLIFSKPAGMPVHPSQNHRLDTLGNAFAAQFPGMTFRPVHRLDQDTSGLVAVAKHPIAAFQLPGRLRKTYLAAVSGEPPAQGTIDAPIARVEGSVILRRVAPEGKRAVTHYRVAQRGAYTFVRVELETGRTHQIRVHFSHIGCPLAGDDFYGGSTVHIARHALHCAEMVYTDRDGREHLVTAPLPEDMQKLLDLSISGDSAR